MKPKTTKENVQVTQVNRSMQGKEILEKIVHIKKQKKEQIKDTLKLKQQEQVSVFAAAKAAVFFRGRFPQLKVYKSAQSVTAYLVLFIAKQSAKMKTAKH